MIDHSHFFLSEEHFTKGIYVLSVEPERTKNVWEEWTVVAELIVVSFVYCCNSVTEDIKLNIAKA